MFTKLNEEFIASLRCWQQFRGETVAKFVSGTVTLEYYSLLNAEEFRKLHIKQICGIKPDRVTIATISGQGFLAPHRDHNTLVTLNYYIQAEDDVTIFYKVKENASSVRYEGKEQANIFNVNDLVECDNFAAKSNEAFLLDVSQVHAVLKTSLMDRIFISYAWEKHPYTQVLDSLRIK